MADNIRVMLVEDDEMLNQSLGLLIGGNPGFEVVATFLSAEEARDALPGLTPDVMLVDLGLPGMGGVELIAHVRMTRPELKMLAHTLHDERAHVVAAIRAGATGYILKGSPPSELLEALLELHSGGAPMSPKAARIIIAEFQSSGFDDANPLSHRETEILTGLRAGKSYKELAAALSISPHTVHTHIKRIYEKLHVQNRKQAMETADRMGII